MSTDREPTYDKLMRLAQTIYAIRTNIHKQKQLEAQQQKEKETQAAEQQRMDEFWQYSQPQSVTFGAPAPVMPQQPTQIGMGMGIGQQQPQMGMGMQVPAFQPQAPGIPQHQINLGTPEPQNAMQQAAMGDPFMAAQLLGDKGMQNIFAPEAPSPPSPYTLGEGQKRFSGADVQVATGGEKTSTAVPKGLQLKPGLINGEFAWVSYNPNVNDGKVYDIDTGEQVKGFKPIPPNSALFEWIINEMFGGTTDNEDPLQININEK